jgi:F-type H+-transporting ATPase subunit a
MTGAPTLRRLRLRALAALTPLALVLTSPSAALAAEEFQPTEEYRLDPWIELQVGPLDLSFNRAVLFLILATSLTIGTLLYIANRMQAKPNRTQTAVEAAYALMRDSITKGNMDPAMARKWFAFIGTLFLFIFWNNLIAYIPLPTNSAHPVDIFGISVPSIGIYGATANISTPLALTLVVWFAYHVEGLRKHGGRGYLKTWVPGGVSGFASIPIFVIESISHFVRIISLSVRLFANILAGHLLILFMAGGLVVLTAPPTIGAIALGLITFPLAALFYIFEIGLIVTLQAFIFATLAAIYLGGATADAH